MNEHEYLYFTILVRKLGQLSLLLKQNLYSFAVFFQNHLYACNQICIPMICILLTLLNSEFVSMHNQVFW